MCEKYKLPTPKVLAHNIGIKFFSDNEIIPITSIAQLADFFQRLFEKTSAETLFIKSFCGYGGKQVMVLCKYNIFEQLNSFGNRIFQDSYIFQEGIKQLDLISEIYPQSINTLRVETYIDSNGVVHILGTFMRFGTNGNLIDNVSSGGIFVPVDPKTGVLHGFGMQSMIHGGKVYKVHPNTGFVFEGFELPNFKEILELSKKISEYIPNKLAGWDIAITPNGPVVIEGNHHPGILIGEIGYGGFVKHPLYKEMMSNL